MRVSNCPWPTVALSSLFFHALQPASAFYLPGVAPTSYRDGDKVPLHVNHLTPSVSQQQTEVQSAFSFDYYHGAFHFCKPEGGPQPVAESLGSILFGDRIQTSPFELKMGDNETCKASCEEQHFQPRDSKFVNKRIAQNYNINWLIDGLPAGQHMFDLQTKEDFYLPGFALGKVQNNAPVLHNHFDIFVEFHEAGKDQFRVVGVQVEPSSRKQSRRNEDGTAECGELEDIVLPEDGNAIVTYTYGIYWVPSSTPFATRWDKYLHVYDPVIHWFSLSISALIVVLLVGMCGAVLTRTLRKDIARYNRLDQLDLDDLAGTSALIEDNVAEDSGWKLVHGDVFRPPSHALTLAVLLGNGAHLFMMTGFTIAFALLGFLSPSNRGSLATVALLLYTFFGGIGGYVSARAYKSFNGDAWKACVILTPLALPAFIFATFFLLNLLLWLKQSSGAVPFSTMLVIIGIWFIISVPLSFGGSWLGFKSPAYTPPVRTNQIPRQLPPLAGYLRPIPSMLSAGIVPFWAIFVELYFIFQSIWTSRVYYMFGFLFICYGLMIIVCAAVTVLMVYFLLCAENYRWQWRSFAMAAASAGYVFGYALIYWAMHLKFASWVSGALYLGYSLCVAVTWGVLTGKSFRSCDAKYHADPMYRLNRLLLFVVVCRQDLQLDQSRLRMHHALSYFAHPATPFSIG